jgi:hypothetical protein
MNATEAAVRRSTVETKPQEQPKYFSESDRRAEEKDAKMTPGERKRMELTRELASGTLDDATRAAKLAELKQSLIAEETQEEQNAFASAPLQDQREAFGLEPPDVPAYVEFDEQYGGWEQRFLVHARNDGLAASDVRGIRDLGVRLGTVVSMTGKPIADDVLDQELSKFNLSDRQRGALKQYWRAIEGGGAG